MRDPAVTQDAPTVDRAERHRAPNSERTGSRVLAPQVGCLPTGTGVVYCNWRLSCDRLSYEQASAGACLVQGTAPDLAEVVQLDFRREPAGGSVEGPAASPVFRTVIGHAPCVDGQECLWLNGSVGPGLIAETDVLCQ